MEQGRNEYKVNESNWTDEGISKVIIKMKGKKINNANSKFGNSFTLTQTPPTDQNRETIITKTSSLEKTLWDMWPLSVKQK